MSGLFISFEGIDGAGKTSHVEALARAFETQGRSVVRTREPGGTPLAEALRGLLLAQAMDPLAEALLLFAARRDHLLEVIEPALAQGRVVLCDRFTDATFAYQGAGRGFDTGVLATLEGWAQQVPEHGLRQPDLTFWFDLPAEVAAQRRAEARLADRFEAESADFFRRVAAGYAARATADPARFARIDANRTRAEVWRQIVDVLVRRGWLRAPLAEPPQGSAR